MRAAAENATILAKAVDGLSEALILWSPSVGEVHFANRVGREYLLSSNGRVADAVRAAAADHRGALLSGDHALPERVDLRGLRWHLRTMPISTACETIFARRHSALSELELLERFRDRYHLADRKLDVLRCILRGRSTLETATVLRIAYPTVRRHVVDLLTALGVRNKLEVFRLADAVRDDDGEAP